MPRACKLGKCSPEAATSRWQAGDWHRSLARQGRCGPAPCPRRHDGLAGPDQRCWDTCLAYWVSGVTRLCTAQCMTHSRIQHTDRMVCLSAKRNVPELDKERCVGPHANVDAFMPGLLGWMSSSSSWCPSDLPSQPCPYPRGHHHTHAVSISRLTTLILGDARSECLTVPCSPSNAIVILGIATTYSWTCQRLAEGCHIM